jgi:MFS transporter, DHA1 family, inner membrane transport protein
MAEVFSAISAGASGGGWVISHHGYEQLHWLGLAWMLVALALSLWAQRVQQRANAHREAVLQAPQPMR